ncbi:tonB dependent receptor family protein [Lysobacter capsici]|uniref:TonB-dependent receptor n=1 Tax=Lysobacter capsici TaxID=435897 RepID=UPI000716640A|nr:TonB-dependent receptor [Lysobacter capsici]ALN85967.1 tonB dependent receptor family protein [Lysobacter capsici]
MKKHRSDVRPTGIAVAVAAVLISCATAPVMAQSGTGEQDKPIAAGQVNAEQANAGETRTTLETVHVSATRIESDLLKTPVTVTAVNQEALTREGIRDVRGLSGTMPNVQIASGPDSGVQVSIRGIGANNFTEIGDPAVGLHVAGLYSPRPQGALALMFDVDQVEVLRGPQGTLFGRNSTGGSINIIPAKPRFDSTFGSAELDVGSYNLRQLNLIQNIAINDRFALRFSATKVERDGWIDQQQDFTDVDIPERGFIADGIPDVDQRRNVKVGRDKYYYNRDEWAARIAARFAFTDNVEWLLAYEKFQNSGAGQVGLKDCKQAAGTRFACQGGKWDVKINVPGKTDMSIDTVRSNLNWFLSDSNSLEYSVAFATQKRSQIADDDGGYHEIPSQVTATLPVPHEGDWGVWPVRDNTSITLNSKYKSVVHELQFKHQGERLKLVSGLFWMHEKNSIDYAQELLVNAPFGYPISQFYHQPNRQIDAKAIFSQADWRFAPTWTATIGARYSRDKKTDRGGQVYGGWDTESTAYYNGLYNPGTPGEPGFRPHNGRDLSERMGPFGGIDAYKLWGPPAENEHSESWRKVTWRLGLTKDLSDDEILFTSLSTGYKAGGFGDKDDKCGGKVCIDGPAGPQYTFFPYAPETVTNFEVGYKGLLLDKRLSLSVTAFYSRYKDMQVTGDFYAAKVHVEEPCPDWDSTCDVIKKWQTVNVGTVNIPGVEVEVDYLATPNTRIGGFFSYIDSKIKDYPTFSDEWNCGVREEFGAPPCPPPYSGPDPTLAGRQIYDITGHHLPMTPKFTAGVNVSHTFKFGNGYELVPWLSVKWQDKMYFTLRNLDNAHVSDAQEAYTTVDASLSLKSPSFWRTELYVLNATDKMTKNWADDAGGFIRGYWNDPRTVGLRVRFDY